MDVSLQRRFAASFVALLSIMSCSSAGAASIRALGFLSGGHASFAYGVSADGSVVVGQSGALNGPQAFRWTTAGMTGLGYLPGAFSNNSYAYGVSANGSIISGASNTGSSGRDGFRWTQGTGMQPLAGGSFTYGISADGSTIVGQYGTQPGRWNNGGWSTLTSAAGFAFRTSGNGSAIVGQMASASGTEAFRWTSADGAVGLGDFDGGTFQSEAYDLSVDGSVIVGYGTSGDGIEAFRWTSGTGMVRFLPSGSFPSMAHGVNGDGSIVVGTSGNNAFVWTAGNGMQNLWDVLVAQGVNPATTGWTQLTIARGVSPDGVNIVGYGTRFGNTEAFVAVVPEPSSLALLALAGFGLLRRRRRKNRDGSYLFSAAVCP